MNNVHLKQIIAKNPEYPSNRAAQPSRFNFLVILEFDNNTTWVATFEDLKRISRIIEINYGLNLEFDKNEG